MPTIVELASALDNLFRQAEVEGKTELLVNSGELHRLVGGYPGPDHQMKACYDAMRKVMTTGDRIDHQPLKGNGASLDIVYTLPRLSLIRHFVAYHKFSEWGPYDTNQTTFSHYSNRPFKFLEKSKGQRIWVIGGEKGKRQTEYTLLSYFSPDIIESNEEKGFHIEGEGLGFNPPISLDLLSWFSDLRKEQQNFSLGINEVKNSNVIEGLLALAPEQHEPLFPLLDELPFQQTFIEGAARTINVTTYKRNQAAREACIKAYGGPVCQVCTFDFEKTYGEIGKGYIQVHHKNPIHKIGEDYVVHSIDDLVPVCPNCHAMLHKTDPPMPIEVLKARIEQLKTIL